MEGKELMEDMRVHGDAPANEGRVKVCAACKYPAFLLLFVSGDKPPRWMHKECGGRARGDWKRKTTAM